MKYKYIQGSVSRNLIAISSPITLGFLFRSLMEVIDLMWIGRISSEAVAAVAIFVAIHWMMVVVNDVIGVSSLSLVTQFYGARDHEKTKLAVEQTICFKALIGFIAGIFLFIFLGPLISFFTNDQEVITLALDYGYPRVLCLPVLFAFASVNTVLRSIGNAKLSMYLLLLATLINLVLDPILMFDRVPYIGTPGLNLGVFGAALATVISTIVSFAIGFLILISGKADVKISVRGLFRLNWEVDKKLLRIGLPSGMGIFFTHFFNLLALKIISLFGTAPIAALGIGKVITGFVTIPLMGLVSGGTTIVGQSLGARELDRVRKTIYTSCFYGGALMMIVTGLVWFLPEFIIKGFTNDPEVIAIGAMMLIITIPGLVFLGISTGMKPAFYGAGYNLPFMLSSLISSWIIQLPFLAAAIYIFNWGINAVWASFVIAQFAEMMVFIVIYKRNAWVKKEL